MIIDKMLVDFTQKADERKSEDSTIGVYWSSVKFLLEDEEQKKYQLKLLVIIKEAIVEGKVVRKIDDLYSHGLFFEDFSYKYRMAHLKDELLQLVNDYLEANLEKLFVVATSNFTLDETEKVKQGRSQRNKKAPKDSIKTEPKKEEDKIEQIDFKSVVIDNFQYSQTKKELTVNFKTGKSVKYKEVEKSVIDVAKTGVDISTYYKEEIKDKYPTI